MFEGCLLLVCF